MMGRKIHCVEITSFIRDSSRGEKWFGLVTEAIRGNVMWGDVGARVGNWFSSSRAWDSE